MASDQDAEQDKLLIVNLSHSTKQRPDSNTVATYFKGFISKCKVGIVAAVVITAILVALSRTAMLIVLTYYFNVSSCKTNTTQINSSDSAEISAESDNSQRFFQVTGTLYVMCSLLNFPEYVVLAYGLYKLLVKTSKWDNSFTGHFKDAFVQEIYKRDIFQRFLCLFFVLLVFIPLSLATPVWSIADYTHCEEVLAYQTLVIIVHIVDPSIRIAMIFTTLAIKAIWLDIAMDVSMGVLPDDTHTLSEGERKVLTKHYECVKDYMQRMKKAKPLLQVFQTWFMIQWFHYYFQAITDLTRILHPWITGKYDRGPTTIYRGIYLAYDFLSFGIPHVCGLKMNSYHQKYLKDKRKKQLATAESKVEYAKLYSLRIKKDSDGDFVPGIPGTGINIPLDSPGYIVGIFLTIFALVANFIDFSA